VANGKRENIPAQLLKVDQGSETYAVISMVQKWVGPTLYWTLIPTRSHSDKPGPCSGQYCSSLITFLMDTKRRTCLLAQHRSSPT